MTNTAITTKTQPETILSILVCPVRAQTLKALTYNIHFRHTGTSSEYLGQASRYQGFTHGRKGNFVSFQAGNVAPPGKCD